MYRDSKHVRTAGEKTFIQNLEISKWTTVLFPSAQTFGDLTDATAARVTSETKYPEIQ